MHRRMLTTVATVLGLLEMSSAADASDVKPPNVILCMADDLGWGDTGYNGHPMLKTPHLDQMAAEGVRFDRFYAAAPVCSPTRGSCLTGRHPSRYGILTANSSHMLPEEVTLAEVLRQRGYTTGHFGKWHLGTLTTKIEDANRGGPKGAKHYSPPWANGFDVCFSTESKVPTWNPMQVPFEGLGAKAGSKGRTPGEPYGTHYWTGEDHRASTNLVGDDSRVIVDRVVPFIRGAVEDDQPFFAIVWFHAPHLPVVAGKTHRQPYESLPDELQHYYGCVTALDEQLGRIRGTLETLGVANDTMLWFTSDNGPEGNTKAPGQTAGLRGRKRSLYEGGIRVPGLLVWPARIPQPRVVETPCVTSDYLLTVLAAIGYDDHQQARRPIDGINLMPIIDGSQTERSEPIGFQYGQQASLVGDRYKLYRKSNEHPFELYDLTSDPQESNDLVGQLPGKVAEMQVRLETWLQSCADSEAGEDYLSATKTVGE